MRYVRGEIKVLLIMFVSVWFDHDSMHDQLTILKNNLHCCAESVIILHITPPPPPIYLRK